MQSSNIPTWNSAARFQQNALADPPADLMSSVCPFTNNLEEMAKLDSIFQRPSLVQDLCSRRFLFEAGPRLEQGHEVSSCLSSELYPSATWDSVQPLPRTLPHTSRMRQAICFWITMKKQIFSEGLPSCLACLRASEALHSFSLLCLWEISRRESVQDQQTLFSQQDSVLAAC